MWKGFNFTLTGTFQRWYSAFPEKRIKSFSSLATKFVNHFSDSRKKENDVDDLYDLRQGINKSLRQYVRKFKEIKMFIPDCQEKSAIKGVVEIV